MSGWEIGDLALCIADREMWEAYDVSGFVGFVPGPRKNSVHAVVYVGGPSADLLMLGFDEFPHRVYDAVEFKKVPPSSESWVEALKQGLDAPSVPDKVKEKEDA